MAMKYGALLGERSDTPRTDAFVETQPLIPLSEGPERAAAVMSEVIRRWAEFARELERENSRKVWPH